MSDESDARSTGGADAAAAPGAPAPEGSTDGADDAGGSSPIAGSGEGGDAGVARGEQNVNSLATGPRLCHFSFVLSSGPEELVLANSEFRIEVGPGLFIRGTTDGSGSLEAGDVEPGDYKMEIAGIVMSVPALNKSESGRSLRVRTDLAEA
jgi:hypothetical protein